MAFTFTRRPPSQALSSLVILGVALGLFHWPAAQPVWERFVTSTPEWVLVVVVPYFIHQAIYWGMSAAFGYVDKHDKPAFIARYRIQSGKRRQPPWSKVWRNLAVSQLLLSPVMMVLLWGALKLRGWSPVSPLPTIPSTLLQLAGLMACGVTWFYFSHRFLHRPWWMKRVHRIHHEFRTSSAIASIYAHPVEFIFGNFLTLGLGVVVVAPSLPVLYLWTILAMHNVVAHHSGYAVPWLPWAVHHDWHHYRFNECFGNTGFWDRLLGTEPDFRTLKHGEQR
jgi:sterol desaturase/sphingolipid hydroxylase (fatty acid hydroxylase superfamily)